MAGWAFRFYDLIFFRCSTDLSIDRSVVFFPTNTTMTSSALHEQKMLLHQDNVHVLCNNQTLKQTIVLYPTQVLFFKVRGDACLIHGLSIVVTIVCFTGFSPTHRHRWARFSSCSCGMGGFPPPNARRQATLVSDGVYGSQKMVYLDVFVH